MAEFFLRAQQILVYLTMQGQDKPLSDDAILAQQKEIAEKLKIITGAKQIKLALKVDPQLIGGFTIEIGSKMIDTSIRGQLRQISALLGA